ncbi:hypothetical protein PQX77_003562 [Marasmius sp. AFHP31]|nr:hypothetical protein PQX77_003562 [Marasmius sp. AFHP31]
MQSINQFMNSSTFLGSNLNTLYALEADGMVGGGGEKKGSEGTQLGQNTFKWGGMEYRDANASTETSKRRLPDNSISLSTSIVRAYYYLSPSKTSGLQRLNPSTCAHDLRHAMCTAPRSPMIDTTREVAASIMDAESKTKRR